MSCIILVYCFLHGCVISISRMKHLSLISVPIPLNINGVLLRDKGIISNKSNPDKAQKTRNHKVSNVRTRRHFDIVLGQLESQTVVDDAQNDGSSSNPSMHISKPTSLGMLLEIKMLQDTHGRLYEDNQRRHEQADNNVRMHWVRKKIQILRDLDPQRHSTNQHDRSKSLDRRMDSRDFLGQICVFQEGDFVYG